MAHDHIVHSISTNGTFLHQCVERLCSKLGLSISFTLTILTPGLHSLRTCTTYPGEPRETTLSPKTLGRLPRVKRMVKLKQKYRPMRKTSTLSTKTPFMCCKLSRRKWRVNRIKIHNRKIIIGRSGQSALLP